MNLLTCPHCGHDRPQVIEVDDQPGDAYAVVCEECGSRGPVDLTEADAAEKWNMRAPVLS